MIHSFRVQTTLSAYRVVSALTGTAHTCIYPPAAASFPLGVTLDTVKDTVSGIPVAGVGERAMLFFNDTVTSGQLVGADTSGRGVPFTIATDTTTSLTITSAYIGPLIGPTIGITGTIAEVMVSPGIAKGTR